MRVVKLLTIPGKNNLSISQGFYLLTVFDVFLPEITGYEMIDDDGFREFRYGKRIKPPVDGMPPLESVIRGDENRIFLV